MASDPRASTARAPMRHVNPRTLRKRATARPHPSTRFCASPVVLQPSTITRKHPPMNNPIMNTEASYQKCIDNSERVSWTINGVLGAGFDFKKRFLPETLAQVNELDELTDAEKLQLNQIRGLTYAHLFGFVEEFIVREIMLLASRYPGDQPVERRALLRFAEEEVKHQILFDRVKEGLLPTLGDCGLVPGAAAVAGIVLEKSELCVLLLTTMLELMTQHHYADIFSSSEERESLDPTFVKIFKSHWIEESQHVRLDQLEVDRSAAAISEELRETAIDELLEVGGAFDGLLKAQVDLDLDSLERLAGRRLPDLARSSVRAAQHKAYRYTFLVSALRNPRFRELVSTLTNNGTSKIDAAASALSA
jgi:hypothetical protein